MYLPQEIAGACVLGWCRLNKIALFIVLQLLQLQLQSTSTLMIVWRLLEDGLLEGVYTLTGLCVLHHGPMHCMLLSSFSYEHLGQTHVDNDRSVTNVTQDYFWMPQ
jgi:hypothetical protein